MLATEAVQQVEMVMGTTMLMLLTAVAEAHRLPEASQVIPLAVAFLAVEEIILLIIITPLAVAVFTVEAAEMRLPPRMNSGVAVLAVALGISEACLTAAGQTGSGRVMDVLKSL